MNDEQKQAFNERVAMLPPAFQEAITESNWEARVVAVGEKLHLYINQIDEMITEVALQLAGVTVDEDFQHRIIDNLMVDAKKADEIIRALNHEVFEPIEESIRTKTASKEPQFIPTSAITTAAPQIPTQPSTIEQITNGVFKVVPEKYSVKTLEPQKKNIDPYHEPIE